MSPAASESDGSRPSSGSTRPKSQTGKKRHGTSADQTRRSAGPSCVQHPGAVHRRPWVTHSAPPNRKILKDKSAPPCCEIAVDLSVWHHHCVLFSAALMLTAYHLCDSIFSTCQQSIVELKLEMFVSDLKTWPEPALRFGSDRCVRCDHRVDWTGQNLRRTRATRTVKRTETIIIPLMSHRHTLRQTPY